MSKGPFDYLFGEDWKERIVLALDPDEVNDLGSDYGENFRQHAVEFAGISNMDYHEEVEAEDGSVLKNFVSGTCYVKMDDGEEYIIEFYGVIENDRIERMTTYFFGIAGK